jgi:hypothetical protein
VNGPVSTRLPPQVQALGHSGVEKKDFSLLAATGRTTRVPNDPTNVR